MIPESGARGKNRHASAHLSAPQEGASAHRSAHRGASEPLYYGDTRAVVIPRELLDMLAARADLLAQAAMIQAQRCPDHSSRVLARELLALASILRTMQALCVYDAGALADLLARVPCGAPRSTRGPARGKARASA